jgi:hypothetical protein
MAPTREAVLRPLLLPPPLLGAPVEVGVDELALVDVASVLGAAEVVVADTDARDKVVNDFEAEVEPGRDGEESEDVCDPDDETSIRFNN